EYQSPLRGRLPEIVRAPGIVDQRMNERHTVAPLSTRFGAHDPELQRVYPLDPHAAGEDRQQGDELAGLQPAGHRPAHDLFHVLVGVITRKGILVDFRPLLARHARMIGAGVLEIVFVQIGIEIYARGMELLMVLGARQRREAEEFQDIDRQFLFDDLDIPRDRFRRVGRQDENVARISDASMPPPRQQHLAVFPDFVLPLLGAEERLRIDVLKPNEYERGAGARGLLDEIRNAMTERVDLQDQLDSEFFALAQLDQPVEDGFPVAVASEIVVRDKKARDALRRISAHDRFDIVGGAVTRDAALHVDDGAEAALKRTA